MNSISISFHTPVVWRERWLSVVCLGLGLCTAVITILLGWQVYAEHQRWDDYLALQKQNKPSRQSSVDSDTKSTLSTEFETAAAVVQQLNTPWASLFSVLESAYSDNAILLGAEPDSAARSIRLTAEAKDTSSMLAFVRQLRDSKVLGDAYVISHVVNQQDPQHPIRFVVTSHWLDAPPSAALQDQGSVTQTAPEEAQANTKPTNKNNGDGGIDASLGKR
jgi:Tfp pilus assembly protein PilN